jgi:hypothetical protein
LNLIIKPPPRRQIQPILEGVLLRSGRMIGGREGHEESDSYSSYNGGTPEEGLFLEPDKTGLIDLGFEKGENTIL